MDLAPIGVGILVSWSLAAPPGPINALMAQAAASRGFWAGWAIGLGATAGDVTMLVLTTLGVLRVVEALPWLKIVSAVVGGFLMGYFAWQAWRHARDPASRPTAAPTFLKGYVIVVTSPYNWGWWLTAGSAMFSFVDDAWVLGIGFVVGIIGWTIFWSGLATIGATRIKRFGEMVSYAAAIVLAIFAALMLYYAATLLSA